MRTLRRGARSAARALAGACVALLALMVAAGPAAAQAAPPVPEPDARWQLTFDEQFDGTTLDGNRWVQYQGVQNPLDQSAFSPDDVLVENGVLRLRLQRREAEGKPFTSGGLGTHQKFNQQYGRFEVVVRAPSGQGLNPYVSLWDDGPNATWPPEIALFECPAEPRTEAVFSNRFGTPEAPQAEELRAGVDCAAGLHTYTVEWTPDALRWFVDGVERGVVTENVPATPMAIVLALTAPACDDPVTGCPEEDTALPAFMEVDRVRVWRLSDDAPPPAPEPVPETAPAAAPSEPAEATPPSPEEPESSTPLSAFTASGPSGLIVLGLGGLSVLGGLGLLVWAMRLRPRSG